MAYRHGIRGSEVPTSVKSPVKTTAGLQVVIGTAPINLAQTTEYVNKPILAYSYDEAVKALGYSKDWSSYTLCETIDCAFNLFGIAPVVFVNVLDPSKHKAEATETIKIENKKAVVLAEGILLNTLVVKLTAEGTDLVKNSDYTATFDANGKVVISVIASGTIQTSQSTLSVTFTKIDPSKVTEEDIIGGYDVTTDKLTGLELINSVFPKFGLVPGQVLAPKFSKNPTVAAVMKAKADNINTYFKAISLDDIDSFVATSYTKVSEWKNTNNYTAANEISCWPKGALGDKIYHLSTQVACLNSQIDSENEDIPFNSPSNKSLQINKLVTEDGTEINLAPDNAAYLNGQGIMTALNFIGGWKAWGNRTSAYPATTDVKDSFIPNRRMQNWILNTIILTTWEKVDGPISKTLADSITDSINIWMNGLTSRGALFGGRIEFRKEDNPTTDLLNGTIRFRIFDATPTPAEDIEFILEFDASYYNRLFQ